MKKNNFLKIIEDNLILILFLIAILIPVVVYVDFTKNPWVILWLIGFVFFFLFFKEAGKNKKSNLLSWFYDNADFLHYIFIFRVPILSGLILFAFPIIASTFAQDFLLNIFVMESWWQLFFVTILTMCTAIVIVSQAKAIFDLIAAKKNIILNELPIFLVITTICLPTWILLGLNLEFDNQWLFWLGIVLLSVLLFFISKIFKSKMKIDLDTNSNFFDKFIKNILGLEIAIGIILYLIVIWLNYPPNNLPSQIQSPTLVYLLLILGIFSLAIGFVTFVYDYSVDQRLDKQKELLWNFKENSQKNKEEIKKLKDDTTLLRYTFYWPVIIFLIVFTGIGYGAFGIDHYFKLQDTSLTTKEQILKKGQYREDFQQAVWNRLCSEPFQSDISQSCDNNEEKSLVVVSASGGGIQASGWMTQVLSGLQQEEQLGENFTKAIALISSTSGGSVGSMFYLNLFENKVLSEKGLAIKENELLTKVVKNATDDWLNAVSWGFAFPDLIRGMGFPNIVNKINRDWKYLDRGYALEKSWEKTLSENEDKDKLTLDNRRQFILKGEIPIPVYNTTLVENGRPFFVSPMKFVKGTMRDYQKSSDNNLPKGLDFKTLYNNCGNGNQACDLAITSAARLSASFPYVTPMARNDRENYIKKDEKVEQTFLQNYHIADGGYYDNAGGFTAGQWVNNFLNYNNGLPIGDEIENQASQLNYKNHHINIKKVLLLQINAFPLEHLKLDQNGTPGFQVVTLGPLDTLAGIRDSTQISRNEIFIKLLKDRWNNDKTTINNINIENFTISFPTFKDSKPPLSWRLTKKQKENLVTAWNEDQEIRTTINCMQNFWNQKTEESKKCDNI